MNTNTVLRFLGWASLTYMWLEANCMFFKAIADAINHHNEQITKDPSANVMNYVKFTAVMAGSIALKKYLEDQKILPDNI